LQKWADNAVSTVKGFVEGLPGNAGAVFLVDSDEAAMVTDQFAEQSRAATVAATGTQLVSRGNYEVVAPS
jgi:hypothetical protein